MYTHVFVMPQRARLNDIDLILLKLDSKATTQPVFFNFWAIKVVLPPGEAPCPKQAGFHLNPKLLQQNMS